MSTTRKRSWARWNSGLQQVDARSRRTCVLYNTCSIRDKAEQKVFTASTNSRRESPRARCSACWAAWRSRKASDLRAAPHVSLVCGSASYTRLPELLVRIEAGGRRVTGLSLDTEDTFETPFTRRDNPHRAYITIIEGCDKSCAYCVVPFTRGPERSRTSDSVMREAARAGRHRLHRDSAAGPERQQLPRSVAGRLELCAVCCEAVGQRQGIRRVRFTTSHPRDFGKEIIDAIDRTRDAVQSCPSAGAVRLDAACLTAMQRLYTRDEYMRRIEWMKNARRNIAITTDIIVGFPGETEQDFEQTLRLLDEVEYDSMFSFKYSPRPNTAALALGRSDPRGRKEPAAWRSCRSASAQIQIRRNAELVGRRARSIGGGLQHSHAAMDRPHVAEPDVEFHGTAARRREGEMIGTLSSRARHTRRSELSRRRARADAGLKRLMRY